MIKRKYKQRNADMSKLKMLLPLFLLFIGLSTATSQTVRYRALESSQLWFDGTSTLHDFTCYATEFQAEVTFSPALLTGDAGETQVGQVTVPVQQIKHENDGLNKNMYKTLEPAKWPEINFDLKTIKVDETSQSDNLVNANVTGDLTIKGETRDITLPVEVKSVENADTLYVNGAYSLLLSNFGIDRPSFFLGTLKVGDEIDIRFDLTFIRASEYQEVTQR
jgi:polyisoprenoid-binding protein YceI